MKIPVFPCTSCTTMTPGKIWFSKGTKIREAIQECLTVEGKQSYYCWFSVEASENFMFYIEEADFWLISG